MHRITLNFCFALLAATAAASATQVFVTPAGATTAGGPVNAEATFTAQAGILTIVLYNRQANPTDVAQLLSDLDFTLTVGGTSTLSSSLSSELFVGTGGTITLGPSNVSTGWMLNSLGGNRLTLCDLCTGAAGPANLIIGPPGSDSTYSNANGSITGNGAHNPFLDRSATFVISNANIAPSTLVSQVVFSFGTTAGVNVPGDPGQNDFSGVPEPASFALGALGLEVVRRRWKKRHGGNRAEQPTAR